MPALDEEETVADVIRGAREFLQCDVLVIDDGSTDRTARLALEAGAHVIQHPFNLGVGAAVRTGLRWALATKREAVVQLDSDGQHEPSEAKRLLDALDQHDLVVGSRFASGYEAGAVRRFLMGRLAATVSRRLHVAVTDTTSGFRAFNGAAIEALASSYPTAYLSDTVEALLMAGDAGLRVSEIAVKMHSRQGGRASSGALRSAVNLARLWLVILLHPVRHPDVNRVDPIQQP